MNKSCEDKQRAAIERLQANQDPNVTPEARMDFMRRIASVKPSELADAPQPAPVKRGRPSKHLSAHGAASSA